MKKYLDMAFIEAKKAFDLDEIPVGCVIVYKNKVIACGHNEKEAKIVQLGMLRWWLLIKPVETSILGVWMNVIFMSLWSPA